MKELSIEEKAKAYDIALKKIKMLLGTGNSCSREELEYVFPELAESEDEKVRNKLIEFFKGYSPDEEWWGNITQEDILAWLEKQVEQNTNKDMPSFDESQGTPILKQGEQKPAELGEEDNKKLRRILNALDAQRYWDGASGKEVYPYKEESDWLKSFLQKLSNVERNEKNGN